MKKTKVTALIPDDLLKQVKKYAPGDTLTESLTTALNDWVRIHKLRELRESVRENPFQFIDGYSAESVRELNRRRRY